MQGLFPSVSPILLIHHVFGSILHGQSHSKLSLFVVCSLNYTYCKLHPILLPCGGLECLIESVTLIVDNIVSVPPTVLLAVGSLLTFELNLSLFLHVGAKVAAFVLCDSYR